MITIQPHEIASLKQLLTSDKKIVITSHHNPDGDAVGSALGLYHILKQQGIICSVILPNSLPQFLSWLPEAEQIIFHNKSKSEAEQLLKNADIIFSLDYNGSARLENLSSAFDASSAYKILIDHHPNPDSGFNFLFSYTNVSSTAELTYEFAVALYGNDSINSEAAMCIYVGIMTDTGSFSYGCNNPRTFEIAAHLIQLGVDIEVAQQQVYNTFSENRMKLLGYALSEKMKVFPEYKAAYISLTREELKRYNYQIGDTEGFVNLPFAIDGIVFSALFIENTDFVKVSLRSRGNFPANEVCENYFHGGGHRNAAGGKSFTTLEQTETIFQQLLQHYSKELNS